MKLSRHNIILSLIVIIMMVGVMSCSNQYRYRRMVSKKRKVFKVSRHKNPYAARLKRRGTPVERNYYIKRRSRQGRRSWW